VVQRNCEKNAPEKLLPLQSRHALKEPKQPEPTTKQQQQQQQQTEETTTSSNQRMMGLVNTATSPLRRAHTT